MIEPDYFGCSGKLAFGETRRLAAVAGGADDVSDFSQMAFSGILITSIDRVHRCAGDWRRFARIALNHAFGDVICGRARPVQVMLSFEFGIDATVADHALCSEAFSLELSARGVPLGKCHSGRSPGVTAVTIATLAEANLPCRRSELSAGSIYLSRPIGAFKLHYLAEMGIEVDSPAALELLERPHDESFHQGPWSLMTDVSGHGLLGASAQTAEAHGIKIDLQLSALHAIAPEVLTVPVECLQNPMASYELPTGVLTDTAIILATARETAGPYLGFVEDSDAVRWQGKIPGILTGHYSRGQWKVDVTWTA